MSDPSDLTTLVNLKQWLNIVSTVDDTLLARLITATSQYIQMWLNRTIPLTSYSDYRDGSDGLSMVLKNYPIVSISSLTVDGNVIPASIPSPPGALDPPGYVFDQFAIYMVGGTYSFTRGYQNVFIQYQAGYAVIPSEIEQACIELASRRYRERDRIGQVSKNIGGEIVTYDQKGLSDAIQSVLSDYQRVITP